jgi:hypothetical protein
MFAAAILGLVAADVRGEESRLQQSQWRTGNLTITMECEEDSLTSQAELVCKSVLSEFEGLFKRRVSNSHVMVRMVDENQLRESLIEEAAGTKTPQNSQNLKLANLRGLRVWLPGCVIQGTTAGADGQYQIKINKSVGNRFGRVLAHEMTHVLVRQTFGRGQNLFLNEGIAEFIAEKQFPSQVGMDLKNSAAHKGKVLRPYVTGYQFCAQNAEHPQFSQFFASTLDSPNGSVGELELSWANFKKK